MTTAANFPTRPPRAGGSLPLSPPRSLPLAHRQATPERPGAPLHCADEAGGAARRPRSEPACGRAPRAEAGRFGGRLASALLLRRLRVALRDGDDGRDDRKKPSEQEPTDGPADRLISLVAVKTRGGCARDRSDVPERACCGRNLVALHAAERVDFEGVRGLLHPARVLRGVHQDKLIHGDTRLSPSRRL